MKLYKNKQSVLGMAKARNKVIDKISSYSERLISHFARCVGYGNSYRTYKDWIHEIATFLAIVHAQEVKYGNGKLKADQYLDTLFDGFGHDSFNDAYGNMLEARLYCKSNNYDYLFDVDDAVIDQYMTSASKLVDLCLPIFITTQKVSIAEFESIVSHALED